jgi:hypothetical protein
MSHKLVHILNHTPTRTERGQVKLSNKRSCCIPAKRAKSLRLLDQIAIVCRYGAGKLVCACTGHERLLVLDADDAADRRQNIGTKRDIVLPGWPAEDTQLSRRVMHLIRVLAMMNRTVSMQATS